MYEQRDNNINMYQELIYVHSLRYLKDVCFIRKKIVFKKNTFLSTSID